MPLLDDARRLIELAERATMRPWHDHCADKGTPCGQVWVDDYMVALCRMDEDQTATPEKAVANSAYIVAAANTAPLLADALARATEVLSQRREDCCGNDELRCMACERTDALFAEWGQPR